LGVLWEYGVDGYLLLAATNCIPVQKVVPMSTE